MANSKKPSQSFTSLRIIGQKAQKMIQGAAKAPTKKRAPLPKVQTTEEIMVHVSAMSVLRAGFTILAVVATVWLLSTISDKIIILVLAMFIATVIDPGVQKLQQWSIPRPIGVVIHYLVALSLIFFLVVSFVPLIAQQLQDIISIVSFEVDAFLRSPQVNLPLLNEATNQRLTEFAVTNLNALSIGEFRDALDQLSASISGAAQQSFNIAISLFGSVVTFMASLGVVLVLAFFMQMQKEIIFRWSLGFFPGQYRAYINGKLDAIHTKLGQWARGQMILSFAVFILTYVALSILGIGVDWMKYSLTLAVLAGFCELIPAVGPFIAAVPAVLIAGAQGGAIWAVIMTLVYYLIQWTENNFLVPLVMNRAVGLSPVAILFAMMIGISFPNVIHPVLGVILAIPTTTILSIFLEDFKNRD